MVLLRSLGVFFGKHKARAGAMDMGMVETRSPLVSHQMRIGSAPGQK